MCPRRTQKQRSVPSAATVGIIGGSMLLMARLFFLLALSAPISACSSFGDVWTSKGGSGSRAPICFSAPPRAVRVVSGARQQALQRRRSGWAQRPTGLRPTSMSFGGGATDRYSWWEVQQARFEHLLVASRCACLTLSLLECYLPGMLAYAECTQAVCSICYI